MDPWIHTTHMNEARDNFGEMVDAMEWLERMSEKGFCPACLLAGMETMSPDMQNGFTLGLVIGVDAHDIAQAELN